MGQGSPRATHRSGEARELPTTHEAACVRAIEATFEGSSVYAFWLTSCSRQLSLLGFINIVPILACSWLCRLGRLVLCYTCSSWVELWAFVEPLDRFYSREVAPAHSHEIGDMLRDRVGGSCRSMLSVLGVRVAHFLLCSCRLSVSVAGAVSTCYLLFRGDRLCVPISGPTFSGSSWTCGQGVVNELRFWCFL